MTSLAASQGICDWIRSGTLPPILEGRRLSGDLQLAQMPGLEGRRGRLEKFGIRSIRLLRLQCYADPHILLPNCSSTHGRRFPRGGLGGRLQRRLLGRRT